MQVQTFIDELGPITVLQELSHIRQNLTILDQDLMQVLPVNPSFLKTEALNLAACLTKQVIATNKIHQKSQIIIAGPELVLLEALASTQEKLSIALALNDALPLAAKERIILNTPDTLKVKIFQIPAIPNALKPTSSIILATGFYAGSQLALIPATLRNILNFYRNFFFGEIVLINPFPFAVHARPEGWVTINISDYFTDTIGIFDHQNIN